MAMEAVVTKEDEGAESVVDELKPGTKLLNGQYTINQFLNNGGFGITYLATDSLNRTVVVKECFPNAFCRRSKTVVAARSRAHQAELRSVVKLFVQEAHNLAKLAHPHIVAVHQVFEDNGTAYMAIDYVDGRDLLNLIEDKSLHLTPTEVIGITRKLLSAVAFIHDHDMLHRDISPDNILLNKKGEPVLIDFGAAREQASRKSRALTALRVVKDGYSPQEFYIAGSEQGPWSDLYALAASLYHLIVGEAPANGQMRLAALAENREDPYQPLVGRVEGYPEAFLAAIDKALNTLPKRRLQSAAEWLSCIDNAEAAVPVPPQAAGAEPEAAGQEQAPQPKPSKADRTFAPIRDSAGQEPVSLRRSRTRLLAACAAASLVAAGSWLATPQKGPAPAAKPVVIASGAAGTVAGTSAKPEPKASTPAVPVASAAPAGKAPSSAPEPAVKPEPQTAVATAEPAARAEAANPKVEIAAAAPAADPAAIAPAVETAAEPAEAAAAVLPPLAEVVKAGDEQTAAAAPAEPGPEAVPAKVTLAETQVNFAAWDVHMPFVSSIRNVNADSAVVIVLVNSDADLATSGDWIRAGTAIFAVNGNPVRAGQTLPGLMLNALHVDPDGYTRAGVEYRNGTTNERQQGLLAVPVIRLISLANGVDLQATVIDGKWQTVVTKVIAEQPDGLKVGDVLHRDKGSDLALDGPQSLESLIADLQARDVPTTEMAVVRDSRLVTVKFALATIAAAASE